MKEQQKKFNNYKPNIYIAMSIIFISLSMVALLNLPDKLIDLTAAKTDIDHMSNIKSDYTMQVNNIQTNNERLQRENKSLEEQLEVLKKENPNRVTNQNTEQEKYAYLTFDDGPSENTTKILDFLKANNLKATFFVIGKKNMDHIYKRIVDEGHTLAIHSNTHDYSNIYQNVDVFMEDITELAKHLKEVTGVSPKIMRFPGGSNNTVSHRYGGDLIMDQIIEEVNEKGYIYFDWNVDSQDASAVKQDKATIVNAVLTGAKGKKYANILMHDAPAKTTTVDALPEIVEGLREQGFKFASLTEETLAIQFK